MDTGQNSNDQVLEGIESLKKKVADNKDANINSAPAKRLDHEILMDVAGTLASFIPEMLSFKSSFEAFANEMITLKAQLKAVEDENSLIKNENIIIRKENASMKQQLLNQEISQCQKSIIVKSLPSIHGREDDESNEDLQESFERVLTQMKLKGQVQISEIYRLKSKQNKSIASKGSLWSPVRVDFMSMIDKRKFFKNIQNINGSIFNEIQINQCVVKSMEKEYKELDKIGFNLRKASSDTKVKIVISKQKYKLLVKTPTEKTYSEYLK